ncbi:MAG: class I SAM-dependent methyltransferase [Halothece sp. Uz-M2-17]|nr:class I SAM-dependent methyltransferase [Halothece sp. Uz-M2-17]
MTNFPEVADIETASEDYAARFSGAIGSWLLQVQTIATLKMLETDPPHTILDVGGGHGQLTKPLIDRDYQVEIVGSDVSCKQQIKSYLDQNLCSFQVANVLALPYPDQAFDVVISYRFLAHVSQWQVFLSELARVAKKAVIIDYPTQRSVNAIAPYLFRVKKGIEGNTRPFTCYQESEILNYFQSLGLTLSARYPQFLMPMVVHRTLKSPKISSALEQSLRLSGLTHFWGSPVIAKFSKV